MSMNTSNLIWDSTNSKWVKQAGSADGSILVTSSGGYLLGNTLALATAVSATGAQTEIGKADGLQYPATIVATTTGRGGADDTVLNIEVRVDANWLLLGTITLVGNETVDLAESISANVAWQAVRANITTFDNPGTGSVTVTAGV